MSRGGRLRVAICTSLCAHGGLCLWGRGIEPPVVERPHRSEVEFSLHELPPSPRQPIPSQSVPVKPHLAARSRKPAAHAPPPAQAAAVPAQELGPVDLTSETFVIGTARAATGGSASSSGAATGTGEVTWQPASSAVSLDGQAWSCPWPGEADAQHIDEQTVVIRVVVDAAGIAQSATLVSDPGHGFGSAAVSCALQTRFTPARDPQGRPVRAQSPPIRVRFTR